MALKKAELLEAYRRMQTIREFEENIHRENTTGEIPGFLHLYSGQEANAVAVCMQLEDSDYISSNHRGHGHCLAKGADVEGMMLELYGKADGLCRGRGGSMHIADVARGILGANGIVGAGAPLATGAALTAKTLGKGGVAVSFQGDGASNEGYVFEAINMAVIYQLPMIYYFENNGYGEFTGHDYAVGSGDIAGRAAACGLPAVKIDGTDFFAVHEAFGEALARARAGKGPSVIEAQAVRFHGHFEGDPQAYRSKEEMAASREHKDCLKILRGKLVKGKKATAKELDAIDAEVVALIARCREAAKAAAYPEPDTLTDNTYVSY
ncbi:thiamine pyrophosphate-dependent dehydrogenase E1 component subunit alpha [Seongchinamella sediminis]|uniref:Thiamine pyrophosphate-dependent dehydrogenase E1 component subunit alpha n=1 Tax=Seongchinamella sediminis TaxID=2283635 RepID=A0A3L7DYQ1_9GAMM|nr:thiamine pyrophosphate-dependent dehydrogenase E1 component subunit alpha [Seongchinamella sediminis]RLQ22384.1 thiamine pyrophosphate-dependent dehydrogenase E1 component subunit alpha [Seongchinamella sediminis]